MAMAIAGCADECTGSIEANVLFAKPNPAGGRNIYVDVLNKPALGRKQTLLYEGKEFGTFNHVVIIRDPTNKLASKRSICFSQFRQEAAATGGDLSETGISTISLE